MITDNQNSEIPRSRGRRVAVVLLVMGVMAIFAMSMKSSHGGAKTPKTKKFLRIVSSDATVGSVALGESDVCIPASGSSGLGYARVIVPATGTISGITLYYQSGEMNHCSHGGASCAGKFGSSGNLNIWITRDSSSTASSNILYPATGTSGYTSRNSWGFYALSGYDHNSEMIKLTGPSYSVTQFEILRVYYGEPFFRPPSSDNSGSTCAAVALTYSDTTASVSYLSMPSKGPEWVTVPSEVCLKWRSGSHNAQFNGYFNGKPLWCNSAKTFCLFFSNIWNPNRWSIGPTTSTGYALCADVNEDPFSCDFHAYDFKVAPVPCQ